MESSLNSAVSVCSDPKSVSMETGSLVLTCQLQLLAGFGETTLFPYTKPFGIKSCVGILAPHILWRWRN